MHIYLANGEVEEFKLGGVKSVDGFAFEWEGEDVVHLRLKRPIHGFGCERKCRFSNLLAERDGVSSDVSYFVHIEDGKGPVAYRRDGEGWKEVALSYIPTKDDLYSRNKGLLEIGVLEKKRVMVIGLGSFGSQNSIDLV